jgi:hypothetical protein
MDKFTKITNNKINNTIHINDWIKLNITNNKYINNGKLIECYDLYGNILIKPLNSVGILFDDCVCKRIGTDLNFGSGGGNCVYGNALKYVDIVSVYKDIFINSKRGILKDTINAYIIPLCYLDKNNTMLNLMNELYVEFILQQKGNTNYHISHICNGMLSSLSSILFDLATELIVNNNINRIDFLINAYTLLGTSIKTSYNHSLLLQNLFNMLPYISNTIDIQQSIITMLLFYKDSSTSIKINWIIKYLQQFYLYNSFNTSFKDHINEFTKIFIIIPLLVEFIDYNKNKLINLIYFSVNLINNKLTTLNKNEDILYVFTEFMLIPCINKKDIYVLYDSVIRKKNIYDTYIIDYPYYVIKTINTNNKFINNYPIMIDNKRYIAYDPRLWCNLLMINKSYKIKIESLGNKNAEFYIITDKTKIDSILGNVEFIIETVSDGFNIIQNNKILKINSKLYIKLFFKWCIVIIE